MIKKKRQKSVLEIEKMRKANDIEQQPKKNIYIKNGIQGKIYCRDIRYRSNAKDTENIY